MSGKAARFEYLAPPRRDAVRLDEFISQAATSCLSLLSAGCKLDESDHSALRGWKRLCDELLPALRSRGHLHNLIHRHRTNCSLVLQVAGVVVAGATFRIVHDRKHAAVVLDVLLLAVAQQPGVCGQGHGTRLINCLKRLLLDFAARHGANPLLLTQADLGEQAVNFWMRQGLQEGEQASKLVHALHEWHASSHVVYDYTVPMLLKLSLSDWRCDERPSARAQDLDDVGRDVGEDGSSSDGGVGPTSSMPRCHICARADDTAEILRCDLCSRWCHLACSTAKGKAGGGDIESEVEQAESLTCQECAVALAMIQLDVRVADQVDRPAGEGPVEPRRAALIAGQLPIGPIGSSSATVAAAMAATASESAVAKAPAATLQSNMAMAPAATDSLGTALLGCLSAASATAPPDRLVTMAVSALAGEPKVERKAAKKLRVETRSAEVSAGAASGGGTSGGSLGNATSGGSLGSALLAHVHASVPAAGSLSESQEADLHDERRMGSVSALPAQRPEQSGLQVQPASSDTEGRLVPEAARRTDEYDDKLWPRPLPAIRAGWPCRLESEGSAAPSQLAQFGGGFPSRLTRTGELARTPLAAAASIASAVVAAAGRASAPRPQTMCVLLSEGARAQKRAAKFMSGGTARQAILSGGKTAAARAAEARTCARDGWRVLLRALVAAYPEPQAAAEHLSLLCERSASRHALTVAGGQCSAGSAPWPVNSTDLPMDRMPPAGPSAGSEVEEMAWAMLDRVRAQRLLAAPCAPPTCVSEAGQLSAAVHRRAGGGSSDPTAGGRQRPAIGFHGRSTLGTPQYVRSWEQAEMDHLDDAWLGTQRAVREAVAREEAELRENAALQHLARRKSSLRTPALLVTTTPTIPERCRAVCGGASATDVSAARRSAAAHEEAGHEVAAPAGADRARGAVGYPSGSASRGFQGKRLVGSGAKGATADTLDRLLSGNFKGCAAASSSAGASVTAPAAALPPREQTPAELLAAQREREGRAIALVKQMHAAVATDTAFNASDARARLLPALGTTVRDPSMAVPLLRSGVLSAIRRMLQSTADVRITPRANEGERLRLQLFGLLHALAPNAQPAHLRLSHGLGKLLMLVAGSPTERRHVREGARAVLSLLTPATRVVRFADQLSDAKMRRDRGGAPVDLVRCDPLAASRVKRPRIDVGTALKASLQEPP